MRRMVVTPTPPDPPNNEAPRRTLRKSIKFELSKILIRFLRKFRASEIK